VIGRINLVIWLLFVRRLAVGWVLVYVTVLLTIGTTPAARPALYGFSGLWLVILTAGTNRRWALNAAGWRWLELTATNVAVTLVLAELALRTWAVAAGGSPLVRANLDAYRLVPGRDYGHGLYGNRHGYPGPELADEKPPGVTRIAALGDSFSLGPAVAFSDCYLTRLSTEFPGLEIGNFGVSGAGPREYREILERDVWPVNPDVVLVAIFVGNDITEAMPRPRSLDPRQHALYLLCQRGWKLARAAWQDSAAVTAPPSDRLAVPALSPQIFREVEARRLAVCLKTTSPSIEKKWRSACNDLEAIVQSCRRRQVALRIVLIPDEFQVNELVLRDALAEAGLTPEQVDLDGPQRRLQAFFAERGVPCLDLLPAFRKVPNTYAPCDTHWNVAGNHLAAREIALWLQKFEIKTGPS
jgi:SGNH hydrolase-like domain, acetyltransferase AlgX